MLVLNWLMVNAKPAGTVTGFASDSPGTIMSYEGPLLVHTPHADSAKATLSIDASRNSALPISPLLYGKFCEHLGTNIYNGMEAQILRNPTFGAWRNASKCSANQNTKAASRSTCICPSTALKNFSIASSHAQRRRLKFQ
jgi:hypothetical protein